MTSAGNYLTIPGLYCDTTSLATKQFYIVQFASTANGVKIGTSATSVVAGVLQNDPAANEAAEVAYSGLVKCAAEASVSVGDIVTCSSTGRAKTTTTGGNRAIGIAKTASGSAGDIIEVLMGGPSVMGD